MGNPPDPTVLSAGSGLPLHWYMVLTQAEEAVVRRAIEAYRDKRSRATKGAYRGVTADEILEELHPTPVRWAELASFVISHARDDGQGARTETPLDPR